MSSKTLIELEHSNGLFSLCRAGEHLPILKVEKVGTDHTAFYVGDGGQKLYQAGGYNDFAKRIFEADLMMGGQALVVSSYELRIAQKPTTTLVRPKNPEPAPAPVTELETALVTAEPTFDPKRIHSDVDYSKLPFAVSSADPYAVVHKAELKSWQYIDLYGFKIDRALVNAETGYRPCGTFNMCATIEDGQLLTHFTPVSSRRKAPRIVNMEYMPLLGCYRLKARVNKKRPPLASGQFPARCILDRYKQKPKNNADIGHWEALKKSWR